MAINILLSFTLKNLKKVLKNCSAHFLKTYKKSNWKFKMIELISLFKKLLKIQKSTFLGTAYVVY